MIVIYLAICLFVAVPIISYINTANREAQEEARKKREKEEKLAEQERIRREKQQERERAAAAKLAEKERVAAAKRAEREHLAYEKQQQREAARIVREQEKENGKIEKLKSAIDEAQSLSALLSAFNRADSFVGSSIDETASIASREEFSHFLKDQRAQCEIRCMQRARDRLSASALEPISLQEFSRLMESTLNDIKKNKPFITDSAQRYADRIIDEMENV